MAWQDERLDADEALRHFLPPESWEGKAQFRFVWRLGDGREMALLARLIDNGSNLYRTLIRPEGAELERLFVLVGSLKSEHSFEWEKYMGRLNEKYNGYDLTRLWLAHDAEEIALFELFTNGRAEAFKLPFNRSTLPFTREEHLNRTLFAWHKGFDPTLIREREFEFLQVHAANFDEQMHTLINTSKSDMRFALHWANLSQSEKEKEAFACENGCWEDFRRVGAQILAVRLGREAYLPQRPCIWNLVKEAIAYNSIELKDGTNLREDEWLFKWRATLTKVFRTKNIDIVGVMHKLRPQPLCHFLDNHPLGEVCVGPLSHHDVLEANLKLREWAFAHFSPDEARRLLEME